MLQMELTEKYDTVIGRASINFTCDNGRLPTIDELVLKLDNETRQIVENIVDRVNCIKNRYDLEEFVWWLVGKKDIRFLWMVVDIMTHMGHGEIRMKYLLNRNNGIFTNDVGNSNIAKLLVNTYVLSNDAKLPRKEGESLYDYLRAGLQPDEPPFPIESELVKNWIKH